MYILGDDVILLAKESSKTPSREVRCSLKYVSDRRYTAGTVLEVPEWCQTVKKCSKQAIGSYVTLLQNTTALPQSAVSGDQ